MTDVDNKNIEGTGEEQSSPVPLLGALSEQEFSRAADTPFKKGMRCRCPRCGDGTLYNGLLDVRGRCETCGFDLTQCDAGDGAQVFVILILGALSVVLGFYLFGVLDLPRWLAMGILMVTTVAAALWMLRVFKAIFIALQFHHDAGEGRLVKDDD